MQKEHLSDLYTELINQQPIQLIGYSDIFDIVITKKLSLLLYLTSCSALSSDNLAVIIDTACPSSFHNPPDRHDFKHIDWAKYQTHLDDPIPFDSELHEMTIDT